MLRCLLYTSLVRPIHAERHLVEHAFREELVACILHDHETFAPTSALSQTGFFQSHGSVASVEAAYGFGEDVYKRQAMALLSPVEQETLVALSRRFTQNLTALVNGEDEHLMPKSGPRKGARA